MTAVAGALPEKSFDQPLQLFFLGQAAVLGQEIQARHFPAGSFWARYLRRLSLKAISVLPSTRMEIYSSSSASQAAQAPEFIQAVVIQPGF